ncbi:hypothetical protein P153DRAFT_416227 [Dothidotthia symphoricarpi CBS 119687]|uniref:Uncharacterized protein n=1 Tax=Dothidotthia symphoricarpi CBS 119687 TaxID=1392245 RepID=A0A6A6AJN0_9PLEO|nr:uncharacterized protein P153DRAFT_416227 [Dothidotthia symphoricarpi CBS 119687]KAF2131318.1 hypothetical protein P153DRAFT_416227 [Dothidotthia symphoricarpi CBS 119687]
MSTKSPATNPTITPDPKNTGSTIRKAFLTEAIANLFTIPLITNTHLVLSFLLAHPARDTTPSTVLFARLFGGIVVGGLTSALLSGYSNTRNGIESRRPTYLMLGIGEAMLIPILVLEALKGGAAGAALTPRVAWGSVGLLAPPLVWRLYVLLVRPDLLGRYTDGEGKKGGVDGGSGTTYGSL